MTSAGGVNSIRLVNIGGGSNLPPGEFLATFRTRKFVPALTPTLQLFKLGGIDRAHGAPFLSEAKGIVDGLLHHPSSTLASLAAEKSAFIDQELAALGAPSGSQGPQDPPSGNSVATRGKIDQLLGETIPGEISIPNRRAVVAQKNDLTDCAKLEAAHRTAEVEAKTKALDTYLEQAKILPEEAQIDEPLRAESAPGKYVYYTIVDQLGEGGMARVFVAEDGNGRRVALKVLMEGFQQHERDFLNEGRRMIKLDHPNIVKGFGVGHIRTGSGTDPRPFFVMELMETSLENVAREMFEARRATATTVKKPELGLPDKLAVFYGLALGHEYAYNQPEQIVHRDGKLANYLLTRDGSGKVVKVKISDFGLSLALSEILDPSVMSKTGTVKGTYSCMAPEIATIANTKRELRQAAWATAGAQPDIYSWGIALYQFIALAMPAERNFAHDAPGWYKFALAKGDDRKPYELKKPASILAELWPILDKATRIDPAERYKSWAELLRDLTPLIPEAARQQPEGDKTQVNIPSQLTELVVIMSKASSGEVQLAPAAVLELRQKLGETLAGLEAKEALATEEISFIAATLDFVPRLSRMIAQLQVQV